MLSTSVIRRSPKLIHNVYIALVPGFTTHLFSSMSNSPRPKVYVTRRVPQDGLEILRPHCDITQWDSEKPVPRAELIRQVAGKDALFCLLTDKINAEVLDSAGPQLKCIGTMSVGYDHIDMAECRARNIPVGFTPDVLTNATAELTVGLLLATSRRLIEASKSVRDGGWGTWDPLWMLGHGLEGSTVGIVGLGRIGMAVARRLAPFGVSNFLYSGHNRKEEASEVFAEFTDFDTLLSKSDFVLGCCALTKENQGLFNKNAFSKMKSNAIFVNTSRGGLVNQEDLFDALKSRQIAAAGLDVTSPEPLPTESPLLSLENCVVLPHIGSATEKARGAMSALTGRNILACLRGESMLCQIK
ncbi:glyoxylate reductase/hydroxypyruvate reductase-like [Saccostrea cucullata]|uniref:glyoxylate reductase/hydroxypyruvate reductase-like n=1 Tax=Saccostrea cuccullata TaxID=36930 RepID=UPI002ED1854D